MDNKDFAACAIGCRKAIFLELEQFYDIARFGDDSALQNVLALASCKAPFFAKNKEYIEKNIKDPTDYIVYDHSALDQELLKYSVDNTSFWNIWRLTPKVYRTRHKQWVVQYDFDKLDNDILIDKIDYIFNTTVDIMLSIFTKKSSVRIMSYHTFDIELAKEETPVYEKADTNSKVICITSTNLKKLNCDYYVTGIQGDGPYWRVSNYKDEPFFSGFIHNDYVKLES